MRRGAQVIRLAISCDICGAEKKQANHWFVAYEHADELRISGWNSRQCKRPGARHLCGQACLHKLVDEFMAQTIAEDRELAAAEQTSLEQSPPEVQAAAQAAPQPRPAAFEDEYGSSARLIPAPTAISEGRPTREPEAPKYLSHQWRSGAWERERKRESFGR
jgi:hypothetical protein